MTNLTLSRRYAKALLAIGQEDGKYEEYGQELADFAQALEQNADFFEALTNPIYPARVRREVLVAVLSRSGYFEAVKNFLLLLQDKDRMLQLSSIHNIYAELVDDLRGILRAKVTSAAPLSLEAGSRVREALEKMTGQTVLIDLKDDPDLIGGLVARVGDLVLDGSVRTQLESLKDSLKGMG